MPSETRQRIRYVHSADGTRIAWADAGSGPLLIKASTWLTHLEHEWESPVWRHWIRFFAEHFRFVRYDERGCGMSDWDMGALSFERTVEDLESVVAAASPHEPFALLGISAGVAASIVYAARHPERVSRLVLYGGYARGWAHRGDPRGEREYGAIGELARVSWGKDNPAFRHVFTSRFVPGATDEQRDWFNELCRKTTSPENAGDLLEMRSRINVVSLLSQIRAPTLVVHASGDGVVPVAEGRFLAAGIPAAQFVELDSANHILLEGEPAWGRLREGVLDFMGLAAPEARHDRAFDALSPRERAVLALLTEGLANAEIAERLAISEKTVRNHVSHLFDKLGVWTRAQAIVFALDRGFRE
jgi:pimeloyl-ACP methyl ester carboxylesterase/DNA-binding CsgD family transcriptional regulator